MSRPVQINTNVLHVSVQLKLLKNIIVCLYAIARRFKKTLPNLKLPSLIQLEDELESLEVTSVSTDSLLGFHDISAEHYLSSKSLLSPARSEHFTSDVTTPYESEHLSTNSNSPNSSSIQDEVDCSLTRSYCETPDSRRYKPNGTPKTPRKSRIPRYSSKLATSTPKLNATGSCSDLSEHESSLLSARARDRSRKSSIPIAVQRSPHGTPSRLTPEPGSRPAYDRNKRSKSVDYKKMVLINSALSRSKDQLADSCDSLENPRRDLRRSRFCKMSCTPHSRCCMKQEVEPRRRRPRDEDYVIMDLDEEVLLHDCISLHYATYYVILV